MSPAIVTTADSGFPSFVGPLMLRLSQSAPGGGVDPFVAQLARLCTAHRTRAKWVFVPTHALGRTLGDRLVLEGTDWANLGFVTPLDIALRMGAPFLVERGIDPSEEGLGPALIMRLLLDLPQDSGYFRSLADQPTMAQALWDAVRELRMAGVRAEQIPPDAFASPAKHHELRALVTAYETFLATEKRQDMATVYEEAVHHPDWCPIQPTDCWTEWPDAPRTLWPGGSRGESENGRSVTLDTPSHVAYRLRKAIAIWKKINKLDATALDPYLLLADLYAKQGLMMEAKSQYQVVVDEYVKRGKGREAGEVLRKMADIDPACLSSAAGRCRSTGNSSGDDSDRTPRVKTSAGTSGGCCQPAADRVQSLENGDVFGSVVR